MGHNTRHHGTLWNIMDNNMAQMGHNMTVRGAFRVLFHVWYCRRIFHFGTLWYLWDVREDIWEKYDNGTKYNIMVHQQKCRVGTVEKSFQGNDNSSRAKGRLSIFTQYRSNCPWVKTEKFSSMHTGAGKCLRDPEKINTAPDGHSPNGLEYGIFQFIAECFTHKYLFVFQLLGVLISRAKVIVAHT